MASKIFPCGRGGGWGVGRCYAGAAESVGASEINANNSHRPIAITTGKMFKL